MKHTQRAKEYATSRVGERGERDMPNEYEWDALASAFTAGEQSRWILMSERLPPLDTEVVALINRNDMYPHVYVCRHRTDERWVAWMPIPANP